VYFGAGELLSGTPEYAVAALVGRKKGTTAKEGAAAETYKVRKYRIKNSFNYTCF
jgi:hypothetical protein